MFKNLVNKILNRNIKPTGYVWNMWEHISWGNSINFMNWDKRLITGHYYNGILGSAKTNWK